MTENTIILEKRDHHTHHRRVCLVTPTAANNNKSFFMPEVILIPQLISDKTNTNGLRSSLRDINTTATAKTVHFTVPLAEILYYEQQDGEENAFEDAFLDVYTKSFHILDNSNQELYVAPPFPTYNKIVYLEQVDWHQYDAILYGTIIVDNLAYTKKVIVRVTLDDWKSYIDVDADYKESINHDNDRFSFAILIPKPLFSLTCRLAIQYMVNDACYWDNNDEKNYTIQWLL